MAEGALGRILILMNIFIVKQEQICTCYFGERREMGQMENKDQLYCRELFIPFQELLPSPPHPSPSLLKSLVKYTHKSQNVYYQTSCETDEAVRPLF